MAWSCTQMNSKGSGTFRTYVSALKNPDRPDLQRNCRHVIHHDLAWNPSSIEQRTGRVDRLGCKAEGQEPITVYLPYLAGAADDRQYKVMTEREQWFRVVMGQDQVASLITPDSAETIPLPRSIADELNFNLGILGIGANRGSAETKPEAARGHGVGNVNG